MSGRITFATRGKSLSEFEEFESISGIQFCWKVDLSKCIDASPLIVQTSQEKSNVVFVGSHSGIFVAVHLESGEEIWRRKFPDRIEGSAAVSFCGKFVFVGENFFFFKEKKLFIYF